MIKTSLFIISILCLSFCYSEEFDSAEWAKKMGIDAKTILKSEQAEWYGSQIVYVKVNQANLDKILDRRKYTSDDFPTSFGSSPRWWVHPAKVKKYYEHKGSDGDFSYISLSVSIDGNVFINTKQDK